MARASIHPGVGRAIVAQARMNEKYYPAFYVARRVGMSYRLVGKLTSSLHVITGGNDNRINLGLSIKFASKNQKVIGYSRKVERGWEFSEKTIAILTEYKVGHNAYC
jgi:5'-3' exoribonuclease 1